MPDIKLRDGSGVENTYEGVDTITLPLADGSGNWTFGPLINIHPSSLQNLLSSTSLVYNENLFSNNYIVSVLDLEHSDNNISNMFENNNYITDLSEFVIGNDLSTTSGRILNTFTNCFNLIHLPNIDIPIIKCSNINAIGNVVNNCYSLDPEDIQNLIDTIYTYQYGSSSPQGCILNKNYKLKEIDLSKNKTMLNGSGMQWTQGVGNQPTLRTIILPKMCTTGAATSNQGIWSSVTSSFGEMNMISSFKFIDEDGEPFVAQMKNQTIDLANASDTFGYRGVYGNPGLSNDVYQYSDIQKSHNIYNGIELGAKTFTIQEITDLYNSVKNYDDWHSAGSDYWSCTFDGKSLKPHLLTSRFNHTSAVEFINSLPDCSEYLSSAGGSNTIKLKNYSGALTDEGGVNDLTSAEIQVATDKGWTVTFVD